MNEKYPQRKRVRVPHWDYRQAGVYAVTICTRNRICVFGAVHARNVELAKLGHAVSDAWENIPIHYANVMLDEFIEMPNHLHGILVITNGPHLYHDAGIERTFGNIQAKSLSSIIRSYKAGVTRAIGQAIWQTGFHEHIIRDDSDLLNHRRYIQDNPAKWEMDRENPDFVGP